MAIAEFTEWDGDQAGRDRQNDALRRRRQSNLHREIGPTPPIKDRARRAMASDNLDFFLATYFPDAFNLKFGKYHLEMIEQVQTSILEGGQYVVAMPRGSGKTTILVRSLLWGTLNGHVRFPFFIAADDGGFQRMMASVRVILETSELLHEDYPEICFPIRQLGRNTARAQHQTQDGKPTHIAFKTKQIVFPTTAWTQEAGNSGACIAGGSLSAASIRGQVFTTALGEPIRPDVALADDPQTRASAKSMTQCQMREDILKADVLGMAGPGKKMALFVTCTVIYPADLADRLLDEERSQQFRHTRVSTIVHWPVNRQLWEEYYSLRRVSQAAQDRFGVERARKMYRDNQAAFDEGSEVYWPERVDPGFDTALESAMYEYYMSPKAFMSERQNEPMVDMECELKRLNPIVLSKRIGVHQRGVPPANVEVITCGIDVQARALYWVVVGWTSKFGGYVLDYGVFPKQGMTHFSLQSIRMGLGEKYNEDVDSSLRHGIVDLLNELNARVWIRAHDGCAMPIRQGLIDFRFRPHIIEEALVLAKCPNWMPALGVGIGAKDTPLKLRTKWKGTVGANWVVQKPQDRMLLSVFTDSNHWKTELHTGLSVDPTHNLAITLFEASPYEHQMFADHCAAEYPIRVEARERRIDEWVLPPNKPDNHFWDTLYMAAVAASITGVTKEEESHVRTEMLARHAVRRIRRINL